MPPEPAQSGLLPECFIILFLFAANGLFVLAEMALVSARKPKLKAFAEEGHAGARAALILLDDPARLLSTVQVGITLIATITNVYGGKVFEEPAGAALERWGMEHGLASTTGTVLVVLILTFVNIVIGELVPKSIALSNPERFTLHVGRPMLTLSTWLKPVVAFLRFATTVVLRPFGLRERREEHVTDEEVHSLIDEGLSTGAFRPEEKEMVEGVLSLDKENVADVMTSRTHIVWLNIDDPNEVNWRKVAASGHSHFPVFQNSRDNVVGMIAVKSLWANHSLAGASEMRHLLTEPFFVPETMPAHKLLTAFKQAGRHIALVTDEFGGVTGLVTLIDVLEAIVGEMPTKDQRRLGSLMQREDGTWLVDAVVEIDEFKGKLGLGSVPGEESGEFQTVSGLLLYHFGKIPSEGEIVTLAGLKYEILDMDRHKIDKVLVTVPKAPSQLAPEGGDSED